MNVFDRKSLIEQVAGAGVLASGIVDNPARGRVVDPFKGADTARTIAEQGSVLLKNANNQLPLNAALVKSIAVIGSHAAASMLSGGVPAKGAPPAAAPAASADPPSGSRLRPSRPSAPRFPKPR